MITLFGGAVQAGTRFDDSLMVIPRFWIENVSHHYYSSLGSNVPITWYIAVKDLDGPLGGPAYFVPSSYGPGMTRLCLRLTASKHQFSFLLSSKST